MRQAINSRQKDDRGVLIPRHRDRPYLFKMFLAIAMFLKVLLADANIVNALIKSTENSTGP